MSIYNHKAFNNWSSGIQKGNQLEEISIIRFKLTEYIQELIRVGFR